MFDFVWDRTMRLLWKSTSTVNRKDTLSSVSFLFDFAPQGGVTLIPRGLSWVDSTLFVNIEQTK